ncbi:MAG: DEAD/DEAH box helicase, partial [Anaerolineales bacterium]|nr:DEAD/DEAH box helicase [Anaerolineales bacterium]
AKPGAVKPAVMWRWTRDPDSGQLLKRPICPVCGAFVPYEKKRGREEWVIAKACAEESCRTKLYNFARWRRVGLARLLQRKFRHVFKAYIADEIQKCKEGDTDTGVADQRLLSSLRYGLALTGTIFGGTAGSLFYLLYRRSREIRRLYAFDDLRRWVDHYGRWERSWKQEKPYVVGQGASTGIKRWGYRQKEIPGVAPGVIRYLLPLTLMAGLSDLGYELPPLEETVQEVPFTPEQGNVYTTLAENLLNEALSLVKEHGDRGVLAAWFNALRFWPNSGFRQEIIHYQSGQQNPLTQRPKFTWHHELPSIISRSKPWLPKEIALADVVRDNMARGRKTLVYLEQTATRDIRPRLQTALESLVPGGDVSLVAVPKFVLHQHPRVGLLNASIAPERREAWVAAHTPALDTLLVNPRLIETGLDLVIFPSLVFYEVTPSLYLFLQAMRRVWRLGQDKAVEVTYLVYQDSIEAEMLRRIGQKLKAALLLHGEHALGALIEQDSDDLLREIIRDRMKGKAFENMGEALGEVLGGVFSRSSSKRLQAPYVSKEKSPLLATVPVLVTRHVLVEASRPVVTTPALLSGQVTQLSLFGEPIPMQTNRRSKKR